MPPLGSPAPEELLVARFRPHGRRLFWSAILLIAVCGATGFFWDNLPEPFENWMILAAGSALVLFGVIVPWLVWRSRRYTVTTRRVIAKSGILSRTTVELPHARGYSITMRRGLLQRMWGVGTLTLSDGIDGRIVLANVPKPRLVNEVLVDQIEVNQILAHRDAQALD